MKHPHAVTAADIVDRTHWWHEVPPPDPANEPVYAAALAELIRG